MRAVRPVSLLLATGAVLVPASPAAAEGAARTGWWNRLSGGGLSAPAPTTTAGDLRVAGSGSAPSAYAAVLLEVPGATDGVLELAVRPGSAVGTPEVVACPTADADWPEGENQPYDTAPAYDCALGSAFGSLSEDGATLSFALDSATGRGTGTWSIALVPLPESTAVFAVDLQPPGATAFTVTGSETAEPDAEPETSAPPAPPAPVAPPPLLPGALDVPPLPGAVAAPPLLAGDADVPLPQPSGPAPAVAGPAAPGAVATPAVPFVPALAAQDVGSGQRLLALLVLAGGSAAVGYAAGQQRPGPRLLGGRARAAVPAGAGVPETGRDDRPRGIGRFARERDAAPRRLR